MFFVVLDLVVVITKYYYFLFLSSLLSLSMTYLLTHAVSVFYWCHLKYFDELFKT